MNRAKFEAIYPLTFLQQRLLIHGLSNKQDDQGFIQVTCSIEGPLEFELLKNSWDLTAQQHGTLRTSIHWENLEKPVQVVHPETNIKWQYLDLSDQQDQTEKRLNNFLAADKEKGLRFHKAPVSRCALIKLSTDKHFLVWTCHHILIDGWSGKVVLQQVFDCYDKLSDEAQYQPDKIPQLKSYLDWLSKRNRQKAQQYWTDYLKDFKKPTLLGSVDHETTSRRIFSEQKLVISSTDFQTLKGLLRRQRITLNTFIYTIWGILLGKVCSSQDIVFGSTVSGRSLGFPNIEKMVGLFMNVLPVRLRLKPEMPIIEHMQSSQPHQLLSSEFEYVGENSINTWIDWQLGKPLFDTLIVTQNLAANNVSSQKLNISGVKGRVTTTHALTLIAEPAEDLQLVLRYDSQIIDQSLVEWISKGISDMVRQLADQEQVTLAELQSLLNSPPSRPYQITRNTMDEVPQSKLEPDFAGPTNALELELTKIWEALIGKYPIGIDDNFFEVGGDSFKALQLMARIERSMKRKVSPLALIQHPTIRSLVKSWKSDSDPKELSSLVPIRASGSKPPLFVIHAGGGHVFFYYPMTKYLDQDQPVYALQPVGLLGEGEKHQSIEEMADYYLKTIRSVRPEGPFAVLGTCLSDPICVEINNKLQERGEAPLSLIIVDSSPIHLFPRKKQKPDMETRIQRFKNRYQQSPYRAIRKIFMGRISKRLKPIGKKWDDAKVKFGTDKQARNLLDLQNHLKKLYLNYKWKKFQGRVTFIKASQNKNWDEEVWQNLAEHGVKVIRIPGGHYDRFEEPYVIHMAKSIQKELDRVQLEISNSSSEKNSVYQATR
jgi:thioesterase domain-containing protein/acyl carrier protein